MSPDIERENAALVLLDEAESSRYESFQVEHAARQFLLCRAGLRKVIGVRLGQPATAFSFSKARYGKPYVCLDGTRAPLSFNVSHSGDFGLIALTASRPVGIDLELPRRTVDFESLGARVLAAEERAALSQLQGFAKASFFYKLWTSKEALTKARGTGLSYNPSSFQVPDEILRGGRTARFQFPDQPAQHWVLIDLGTETYGAALAFRSDD
ncbi:MAG: 4'-phosphopantetheinyl transferase superfamily protein [Hyphomicrobiales bacterium]|nr:4'-phosphopantetheinyl transferase superfamily protein [Hyphomicrobiales bacterium]